MSWSWTLYPIDSWCVIAYLDIKTSNLKGNFSPPPIIVNRVFRIHVNMMISCPITDVSCYIYSSKTLCTTTKTIPWNKITCRCEVSNSIAIAIAFIISNRDVVRRSKSQIIIVFPTTTITSSVISYWRYTWFLSIHMDMMISCPSTTIASSIYGPKSRCTATKIIFRDKVTTNCSITNPIAIGI